MKHGLRDTGLDADVNLLFFIVLKNYFVVSLLNEYDRMLQEYVQASCANLMLLER